MNSTMEKMRKAHEKQAKNIRRKPGFDAVSKAFDAEYAIANELYRTRTKTHPIPAQVAEHMGTTQSVVSRLRSGFVQQMVIDD